MRRALALLLLVFGITTGPAETLGADWEVRRGGSASLREHALRRLLAAPEDATLAARVVSLAGAGHLGAILERLRVMAAPGGKAAYGPTLAHAQTLLAAGRAGEAVAAFVKAAGLRPEATAPLVGRARALALARRPDEALAAYEQALEKELRPPRRRELLNALVALAARTGDVERELEARRRVRALNPGDIQATLGLARVLGRVERPAEGARLIDDLVRANERRLSPARRHELLREEAALREAAGDDAGAQAKLQDALVTGRLSGPERAELNDRLLAIARRQDTVAELEAHLERIASGSESRHSTTWKALAAAREELGDDQGALEAWRRATALDPRDPTLRRRLLGALDRLGVEAEVVRAYEELAEQLPGDAQPLLELIERKYRRGEKDEARRWFDQAVKRFRRHPEALARLADQASRWGDDDRVLACWDAVLAVSPRDERAIVGLGEAHFQRGRRELARRTWFLLRKASGGPARSHARLAEILGDHEFIDEAIAEARAAQRLDPAEPGHHRTLARILERKKDISGATSEWRLALAKSTGPSRAGERREARARIIGLLQREGRERLRAETVLLKDRLRRHPDDRETALHLAEIQVRLQEPGAAVATLTASAERLPQDAEIVLMLVRLLRQSRQLEPAISHLEALAAAVPARAQEARLQIAEIRLQQYRDTAALEAAERAVAADDDDADALMRIADLQERLGRPDLALATYRRVLARQVSTKAALAVQRLLVRAGQVEEASRTLRAAARAADDAETRADLLGQELDLAEFLGELPELAGQLGAIVRGAGLETTSERRAVLELMRRTVPAAYVAAATDRDAAGRLRALARRGLRPLVDLLTDPEGEPSAAVVELLGMLGNQDATPVLMRLAQAARERPRPGTSASTAAVASAAVVALGRLRDQRAAPVLQSLAMAPDAGLRAAAVWALGRIDDPRAVVTLEQAVQDSRTDVSALALLGLGRLRAASATGTLQAAAADVLRPGDIRRAAVLGLALGGSRRASAGLLPLLDAADPALARAAAVSLGSLRDPGVLPPLWRRALVGPAPSAAAAMVALRVFADQRDLPDDGPLVGRDHITIEPVLEGLAGIGPKAAGAAGSPELEALWVEHVADLETTLVRALESDGEERERALVALDRCDSGLGLGALTASNGPATGEGRQALGRLAVRLRGSIAALLEHPERTVQLRALRVATKLRDPLIGVGHVLDALAFDASSTREDASGTGDVEPAVRAAKLLIATGKTTPQALGEALRGQLAATDWERRVWAVRVLGVGGRGAIPWLERALQDESPFVRFEAARALSAASAPGEGLVRAGRDASAAVREAAVTGLAHRPDPLARQALEALTGDHDARVRAAARRAMKRGESGRERAR